MTPETRTFGFMLFPGFSMLSFAAALEPLRIANRMSGTTLYQWDLLSRDDGEVLASNNLPFSPTIKLREADTLDALFLVAGIAAHLLDSEGMRSWLRQRNNGKRLIGSISTGSLLLARAGLLDRKRCTIHWESHQSLLEEHSEATVTGELFEQDGRIWTCSGGVAGLDMMLHLIGLQHGNALMHQVAEQCVHPSIRSSHDKQRMSLESRLGIHNPKLISAITLMQNHLEGLLSCEDIARMVGLSYRQMQRLFSEQLQLTPAQYYLKLRLERARELLLSSSLPILEVALACGFSTTSHFARCHREMFGVTPRQLRQKH